MSVNPPDATAMLPRFSSPAESRAEVGSRSVALHTSPNVITNFAFDESMVGYAFAEIMEGRYRERRIGYFDIPDRPCLEISFDPFVSVLGSFAVAPCC